MGFGIGSLLAPIGVGTNKLFNALGGDGGDKVKQEALETPEQRAARRALLGFANTGKHGQFEAGAEMDLGYGDFGMTGIEGQGQSALMSLLQGGIPEQFRMGDAALQDFLQTDPNAIDAQFNPFRSKVDREARTASDAYKRSAGFAGSLYSTDTMRGLGEIESRGLESKTAELARLTDNAMNRRLSAIPLAYQSGEAQNATRLGQIGASQQYGGLARQLNDASIKARDTELLRRRAELQLPIQALTSVAGGAPQFGVPEVETSPYQELLGMAGQIGGNYLGNELYMKQYQRYFPGSSGPLGGTK